VPGRQHRAGRISLPLFITMPFKLVKVG